MKTYHSSQLIQFLDYTSLNEKDTSESITQFCHQAENQLGRVAAVCIYPQFVSLAASLLRNTQVKIATVVNFPLGDESLESCYTVIKQAIDSGANEIDAVIPYQRFLAGEYSVVTEYVQAYREACTSSVILKVILETGVFHTINQVAEASELAIRAGANFIKTSTGKVAQGASLEVATTILKTIKFCQPQPRQTIGMKISGGISSISQAEAYYRLAQEIMGNHWVHPGTFRIGSSRLLALLCQAS